MKTTLNEAEKRQCIMLSNHYDVNFLAQHFKIDVKYIEKFLMDHNREIRPKKLGGKRTHLDRETALEIYKLINDENSKLTYSQISRKYNVSHETILKIKNKETYTKFFKIFDLEIALNHLDAGLKKIHNEEFEKARDIVDEVIKYYYD